MIDTCASKTLSGKVPFSEIKAELRVAFEKFQGALPGRPAEIGDAHWEFILKCCNHRLDARPTVEEVASGLKAFRDVV